MDSTTLELLKIVGPAIWIIPVIYLFFIIWRRQAHDRLNMERERIHEERKRYQYEEHGFMRGIDRDERYNPRLIEELVSRLARLDSTIDERFDKVLSAQLAHALTSAPKTVVPKHGLDSHEVARDLSHALNTPLSQIEAATSTELSVPDIDHDKKRYLESTLASVQICKAFLGAYRELNSISASSNVWSPNSLQEALTSAGEVYTARTGKSPKLDVDLPVSIDGYSNNYITALLLPILENAIESSKSGTSINVGSTELAGQIRLTVVNEPEEKPGGDEIYQLGHTTKGGHDGTGLSSVTYLLSGQAGAAVSHEYVIPHATFSILLPGRES